MIKLHGCKVKALVFLNERSEFRKTYVPAKAGNQSWKPHKADSGVQLEIPGGIAGAVRCAVYRHGA